MHEFIQIKCSGILPVLDINTVREKKCMNFAKCNVAY